MTNQPQTKTRVDALDPIQNWLEKHPKVAGTIGGLIIPTAIIAVGLIEAL